MTGTKTAKKGKTPAKVTPKVPDHRRGDIAGAALVAAAALVLVALVTRESGLVGRAAAGALGLVFGLGAWGVPLVLVVAGVGVWRGRGMAVTHLSYGLTLILLAALGFLARSQAGDFFDPTVISTGGGYLGAALGWVARTALGVGAPILFLLVGFAGLVLCVDVPLRELAADARRRAAALKPAPRAPRPEPAVAPRPEARDTGGLLKIFQREAAPDTAVRTAPAPAAVAVATPAIEKPREVKPEPKKKAAPVEDEEPALDADLAVPVEGYTLPPVSILAPAPDGPERDPEELRRNIATLEGTLDQFGISGSVVEVANGPTVTRYEIQIGPGVKVSRVSALGENIAMDLAATQVRVEAPIPGKNAVGVEVPNNSPMMVSLRELCETKEFLHHKSKLCVALGKDVGGVAKYADLTRMPHLLIGGATNSGKSIGLATLITSLLMRNTPKDVRLVMIDPKRVELTLFDGIPHLMCPVIKDVKEAAGVLRAVWREMDRRYDLFSENGVRNIDGWNEKAIFSDRLPYIVVIVDELADLMIQCRAEVETTIVRLAQLARAVGIHLVLATQRPSVDVITGLIKANIPSRIAFSVASQIDSRTIIDAKGAENLIGKGDMLFSPIDANRPHRVQGCYVSEREIEAVCNFWKEQQAPEYVLSPIEEGDIDGPEGATDDDLDPLWADAVRWAAERGEVSTSMLQRRFAIGFQRASRLVDTMEARGIVGRRDGPRARDVLVNLTEVDAVLAGGGALPRYDVGPTIGDGLEA